MNIFKSKVEQVFLSYKDFNGKDNATIQISAWANCEGHVIEMDRNGQNICFSLTHGDWAALQMAMNATDVDSAPPPE